MKAHGSHSEFESWTDDWVDKSDLPNGKPRIRPAGSGWTKSSKSSGSGCCVEARLWHDSVLVRDSKFGRLNASLIDKQPVLRVDSDSWSSLIADIKDLKADLSYPDIRAKVHAESVELTSIKQQLTLTFTPDEWSAFVAGVLKGELTVEHLSFSQRRDSGAQE